MQLPTAKEACLLLRQSLFWKKKAIYFRRSKERFPTWFSPSSDLPLLLFPLPKKTFAKNPCRTLLRKWKEKGIDLFIPCHCHSVLGHPVAFSVRFVFGLELAVPSWKWSRFLCRPKSIGTMGPTNIFLKLHSYFRTIIILDILHHFNDWKLDDYFFLWKQRGIRNSNLILKHYLTPLWHFIQERKRGATQHHSQDRVVAAA